MVVHAGRNGSGSCGIEWNRAEREGGRDGVASPPKLRRLARRAGLLVGLAAFFAGGLWLSQRYDLSVALEPVPRASATAPDTDAYPPRYSREVGPERVFVYVGSSSCTWSNDPGLPPAVERLKVELAGFARDRQWGFRTTGIALDWRTAQGVTYLDTFGLFDEISVGYNWQNSTVVKYAWDEGIHPATPAVLIYTQELVLEGGDLDPMRIAEEGRTLLLHRTGLESIRALAEVGPQRFLSGRVPEVSTPLRQPGRQVP